MNPEIFIHYGHRLRTRAKIARVKSKIILNQAKNHTIRSIETSYFYMQEIRIQSQNFKRNLKDINRYDYE